MAPLKKTEIRDVELTDLKIEKTILGVCIASLDTYLKWQEKISWSDFSAPVHQRIWKAMFAVSRTVGQVLIPSLIIKAMEKGDESVNLDLYLRSLRAEAGTIRAIDSMVEALLELSARRALQVVAQKISDLAIQGRNDATADSLMDEASSIIAQAGTRRGKATSNDLGFVVNKVVDKFFKARESGATVGLRTKTMRFWNDCIGPMMESNLIVIVGATSSGKSALVSKVCWDLGQQGIPTAELQAEMDDEEVGVRHLARMARVPVDQIIRGEANEDEAARIAEASYAFNTTAMTIDAERGMTISAIASKARRLKREKGIRLLTIDHMRDVRVEAGKRDVKDHEHMYAVSQGAKDIAKELKIPVILIGQFLQSETDSYNIKTAADIKMPHLGLVYGGSAIRQHADVIAFVHRQAYYLARVEPSKGASHYDKWRADLDQWEGKAQLIKQKGRMGKGFSKVEMMFEDRFTDFYDKPLIEETQETLSYGDDDDTFI